MRANKTYINNENSCGLKPQLFCFSYAGGSASFFDVIEKDLDSIEMVKLEYSGHGTRRKEPFYKAFDELVEDMYNRFEEAYKGGTFALFGYSMGSLTVIELLKRMIKEDEKLPFSVFLAAHEPRDKYGILGVRKKDKSEIDNWVKERTIQFGAVPKTLIDNAPFWRMYLPLYKADYMMIAQYRFENLDIRTSVPATVFYSETDTPLDEMRDWDRYFVGDIDFIHYEGDHFFINDHHKEIAYNIKDRLEI